jgi:hypothetical protein
MPDEDADGHAEDDAYPGIDPGSLLADRSFQDHRINGFMVHGISLQTQPQPVWLLVLLFLITINVSMRSLIFKEERAPGIIPERALHA